MYDSKNTTITNIRFDNGSALSYSEQKRLRRKIETEDSSYYTIGDWWTVLESDYGEERQVNFTIEMKQQQLLSFEESLTW